MKHLTGNKTLTKKITFFIVPYFDMYYGAMAYMEKPEIDKWGLNTKEERGYQISIAILYDYLGINDNFENYDYDKYKKVFEDEEGGFKGGLVAETIKITGNMPVDKEGDIIFAF